MKKILKLFIIGLMLLGFTACDNDVEESGLANYNATINVSESSQIELVNLDLSDVTFKSNDESIVRVDEEGVFVGLEPGSTKIIVKALEKEWEFNVYVQGQYLNIDLVESDISIDIGDTYEVNVTTNDTQGLEFNSLDKNIATVDEHGLISALVAGETSIVISSVTNPSLKRTLTVNVIDPRDPFEIAFENTINNTIDLTNYTLEFSIKALIDNENYYHTILLEFDNNISKLTASQIEEYYEVDGDKQYRYYQTKEGFVKEDATNLGYEPFLIYEDFKVDDFTYNAESEIYSLKGSSYNLLNNFIKLFSEDGTILLFKMSFLDDHIDNMSFMLIFDSNTYEIEINIKDIDNTNLEVPNNV